MTPIVFPFSDNVILCARLSIPFAKPLTVAIPSPKISGSNFFNTSFAYGECLLAPTIANVGALKSEKFPL